MSATHSLPPTVGVSPRLVPGLDRLRWSLGLAVAAVVMAMALALWMERTHQRDLEAARLASMSQLRADQISIWLRDLSIQMRFAASSQADALYQRWRERADAAAHDKLVRYLTEIRAAIGGYRAMVIHNGTEVVADTHATPEALSAELRAAVRKAMATGQVKFTPLHGAQGPPPAPRLDLVAPLSAPAGGERQAVIVVRMNPREDVLGLLRRWPVDSATAVALLVREDAGFLVGAFEANRIPISAPHNLAARALRGEVPMGKAFSGTDYRGVPVIGVVQPVQGTDWHLVTKVDSAELVSDSAGRMLAILAGGLLALAALTLLAYWMRERQALASARQQQKDQEVYRAQLEELVARRTHELAQRNQSLERSVRDLEAFSASVSHDLQGPLRTMSGFANVLAHTEGSKLSDNGRQKLTRIVANAATMSRMIDDILRCSRAERVAMERGPVDVGDVVRDVVAHQAQAYPAAQIRVGDLPVIDADAAMVRQIFDNLIGNALKFSATQAAPVVQVDALTDPAGTLFRVSDNGVGFDTAQADKLYAPFQRLHSDEAFPGTGVGLSIVRRLVERHGGHITATTQPGHTVFSFSLGPQVQAPAAPPQASATAIAALRQ